jgi:hypothetical protein
MWVPLQTGFRLPCSEDRGFAFRKAELTMSLAHPGWKRQPKVAGRDRFGAKGSLYREKQTLRDCATISSQVFGMLRI